MIVRALVEYYLCNCRQDYVLRTARSYSQPFHVMSCRITTGAEVVEIGAYSRCECYLIASLVLRGQQYNQDIKTMDICFVCNKDVSASTEEKSLVFVANTVIHHQPVSRPLF